ncbi:MAG: hypothetical protein GY737_23925 [Desulfobacteraceae bacterium]|nr:hypothetical protein [Desulfobacteraceae bacterium]
MPQKQTLGQILVQKKLISSEKIERALGIQTGGNRRLGQILIQMGLISDEDLFSALSDQHGIPIADMNKDIAKEALQVLPRFLCKRYSVIPLGIEKNNVLNLAMVNPLDQAARSDIEAFTGMVISPFLAKEKAVTSAIHSSMPITFSSLLKPLVYNRTLKIACTIILVLSVVLGFFVNREIRLEKYGTISGAGDLRVFSNHEMLIGVEGKGAISLIGHGPYAKGFYSVVFDTTQELLTFVDEKKEALTNEQYEWIQWVALENLPLNNN